MKKIHLWQRFCRLRQKFVAKRMVESLQNWGGGGKRKGGVIGPKKSVGFTLTKRGMRGDFKSFAKRVACLTKGGESEEEIQ